MGRVWSAFSKSLMGDIMWEFRKPIGCALFAATAASGTVPGASSADVPALPSVPAAPSAAAMSATPDTVAADSVPTVTVTTDVLRLTLDGGAIHSADLLKYPQSTEAGSAPVVTFGVSMFGL